MYSMYYYSLVWEGPFCTVDVDGCEEISCFQDAMCDDIEAPGFGATCPPCPLGFVGDGEKCSGWFTFINIFYLICFCIDVNECENGTICEQECINIIGSFTCACFTGFELINDTHCTGIMQFDDYCYCINV